MIWLLSGCSQGYETIQGQTMGTYFAVRYNAASCELEQPDIQLRLRQINRSMSTYDPTSEISKINQSPAGTYQLSADFVEVLAVAQEIHAASSGAFDVTVGALTDIWGFGPTSIDQPPSQAVRDAAAQDVGMQLVELNGRRIDKKRAGVNLNFSALAKGYAVDELAELAERAGCVDFMIDIGGEIRVGGQSPSGQSWRVGIEVPDARQLGTTQAILTVQDTAIATSGDYRNFQDFAGRRVTHIFDPRVASPIVREVVSATVVHPSAMLADGYATAFMVLSVEESLRVAEAKGLAVYLMHVERPADKVGQAIEGDLEEEPETDANRLRSVYNEAMKSYLTVQP